MKPETQVSDVAERLTLLAAELIRMKDGPRFGGTDVVVRVAEPDALIGALVASRDLIERQQKEISELRASMLECNSRLNALSMGTEGYLRSRICLANNFLNEALGRTKHFIADNWTDDGGVK